jgi:hypothetical protein
MMPGPSSPEPPPYHPPVAPFRAPPPCPPYEREPPVDAKAILSLVLGILSVVGCGVFLSGPAIFLGVLARRDARRSGGTVGGSGLATAGIVTGALGGVLTLVVIGIAAVVMVVDSRTSSAPSAAPTTVFTTPQAPSSASTGSATGPEATPAVVSTSIDVVTLTPSTRRLRDQLRSELRAAEANGETLLVQTSASWAPVCNEIDASLGDKRMESALAKVRLVRVDVDAFEADLKAMRMYDGSVPWFFMLDAKTARPHDAIGADEWDDNVAANMAPVLGAFVKGTYAARRHGSPLGGTSL